MEELERKELEESIDATVEEMKKKIDEISDAADGVSDESAKEKVAALKERAVSILTKSIEKLSTIAKNVKDSEQVKQTVEFVGTKSKELADITIAKINEIKESQEFKDGVNKVGETLKDVYANVKEGAGVVAEKAGQTYTTVKENVDEFFKRPDVQEKIEKGKKTTVDTAQKAVDALRAWLYPEEENKDN